MNIMKKRVLRQERIIVDNKDIRYKLDSYYRLRDNVIYALDDGKNKVVQITSSVSGEAKTTTVCNLAVMLGESGKKTLVIDLDFRRASVHKVFKTNCENGIAEYMLGTIDIKTAIKNTSYTGVDILPRGSMIYNSAVVFTSDKFKALIESLRSQYDVILIDTSPVLLMSDYVHISKLSELTLFLVGFGQTKKSQVRDAISELRKCDANIIGVVFTFYNNRIDMHNGYYGNYYTKK